MSDSTVSSPSSILNFLRFKWVSNSKRSPRIVFRVPEQAEQSVEQSPEKRAEAETFTDKVNEQNEKVNIPTIGQLDTMAELDGTPVKTPKSILKKSLRKSNTTAAIEHDKSPQSHSDLKSFRKAESLMCDNLNESKSKKVTFSIETKKTEADRNLRYIRISRRSLKRVQNITQLDNQTIDNPSTNNLTPAAEPVIPGSSKNIFKITRTSDLSRSLKFSFNANVQQSPRPADPEGGSRKNLLKIPSFEQVLESDGNSRAYPSLQAMLEDSPISPETNSPNMTKSLPQVGSLSARNAVTKSPWDAYFQNRELSDSLTPKDSQLLSMGKKEKNWEYYAELQKKTPVILPHRPARPESQAGLRPNSKNGVRANISVLIRREFIKPTANPPERL